MRRPHKRIDIVENHDSSRNLFSENPTGFEKQALTNEVLLNLDQRDREMLRSILRLDISTAREVMVPRLDIVAIHASASPAEAAVLMAQSGHSRLPVYEDTIDHISGIVHSRDLLDLLAHPKPDKSLKDFWRPAFFIPESKRLDDLLEELQEKALQLVIVVDEYGGTEGLVTMEDLLEEVFGEIEDEFSRTLEPQIVHQANNAALVDAKVTTEAIEELFSIKIDIQDVDTVGGYVYHMLGKIPQIGDVVTTNDLQIEVISVLGRRLRKLRIKPVDNSISKPDA
jgi:putative hemolysin